MADTKQELLLHVKIETDTLDKSRGTEKTVSKVQFGGFNWGTEEDEK